MMITRLVVNSAESYFALSNYVLEYGRYDEAEKLCRSARTIFARLSDAHPMKMTDRKNLCDEPRSCSRSRTVKQYRAPSANRATAQQIQRRMSMIGLPGALPQRARSSAEHGAVLSAMA
jgi:hypothetical protein